MQDAISSFARPIICYVQDKFANIPNWKNRTISISKSSFLFYSFMNDLYGGSALKIHTVLCIYRF